MLTDFTHPMRNIDSECVWRVEETLKVSQKVSRQKCTENTYSENRY